MVVVFRKFAVLILLLFQILILRSVTSIRGAQQRGIFIELSRQCVNNSDGFGRDFWSANCYSQNQHVIIQRHARKAV